MNIFQKILKTITFGGYNPEKKFEQEVLGEATTNLEEIENLRTDVEKAVSEYDKYFPNESNKFNNYELYDSMSNIDINKESGIVYKNNTVKNLVELEEQLQEQGKYVGMNEETRIKAILAEGNAAENAEWLSQDAKANGESVSKEMLDAFKISRYQAYMNDREFKSGDGHNFNDILHENKSGIKSVFNGLIYGPRIAANTIKAQFYGGGDSEVADYMQGKADTEKYISMILANEKATRQSNGTYLTKTSEEWKKIDTQMEDELRSMPQKSLIAKGQALEKELKERYNEIVGDREEMQQSTNVNWSKASKMGIKNTEDLER